jgi:hypothetical protein
LILKVILASDTSCIFCLFLDFRHILLQFCYTFTSVLTVNITDISHSSIISTKPTFI